MAKSHNLNITKTWEIVSYIHLPCRSEKWDPDILIDFTRSQNWYAEIWMGTQIFWLPCQCSFLFAFPLAWFPPEIVLFWYFQMRTHSSVNISHSLGCKNETTVVTHLCILLVLMGPEQVVKTSFDVFQEHMLQVNIPFWVEEVALRCYNKHAGNGDCALWCLVYIL